MRVPSAPPAALLSAPNPVAVSPEPRHDPSLTTNTTNATNYVMIANFNRGETADNAGVVYFLVPSESLTDEMKSFLEDVDGVDVDDLTIADLGRLFKFQEEAPGAVLCENGVLEIPQHGFITRVYTLYYIF